jgi:cell fate (sporulation/competence/biofilm development) regulator YlbF (YheA/YmcA/DUF963 family)
VLEDKAKELGRIIGQSEEYKAVKRSTDALNGDAEAMKLLARLEELRAEAGQLMQQGQQPTQAMEEELDTLLGTVQSNVLYQRAVAAQENFDKIMYQVNNWILEGIKKGSTSSIITLG